MKDFSAKNASPEPIQAWNRLAFLLGRIIILLTMIYIPCIFYTWTWHHYATPKSASLQHLVMMLLACWAVISCGRRFKPSAVATPAAFFFMMVIFNTLAAVNMGEAWETVSFMTALVILLVLIPKFFIRLKDFEVFAYLLGILCIFVDLYGLAFWYDLQWFFKIFGRFGIEKFDTNNVVSFMGNQNYTGDFLNIVLPVCFTMILCHLKKPAELIFFTFVTILNFVSMLYIDCNASFMGFMVSIPLVAIVLIYYKVIPWMLRMRILRTSRPVAEVWFRQMLVVGVFLFALFATYVASVPNKIRSAIATYVSWVDVNGDKQPDGVAPIVFRLQCMDAAIRNISDSPFIGIGAGNFKIIHPYYENQLERKVLGEEVLARKAHNDHLYHAVEFGLFGLFGWYWIIATTVFTIFFSFRIIRSQEITPENGSALSPKTQKIGPYEREFYFYLQLGLLGGIVTAVVSTAASQTFVIPSSASTYYLISGISIAAFQVLHRSYKNIPKTSLGMTKESLTPIQTYTRMIPLPVRWGLFFAVILPLGALNPSQMIGEMWLKQGMAFREGLNPDRIPNFPGMFYCFKKALKYYPYQMEIYYILGRYYIDAVNEIDNTNMTEEAGRAKLQAFGLADMDRRKLIEAGIVSLQTDVFMNPNYKWAHNNLGVLYDKLPNFTYSSSSYGRVFQIDTEQVFAHYNMGLGYMRHQKFDKAIQELEAALLSDPSKYEVYRFLCQCFIEKKDYHRAIAAADKYLSRSIRMQLNNIRPSYPYEELKPIVSSVENDNLYEGLQHSQPFFTLNDEDLYVLYFRIAYEMFLKDPSQAALCLNAIQKAERIISQPPEKEFFLLYANVYDQLEDYVRAAEKFEEFLRLEPNHVDVRRKLANLYSMNLQRYDLAERVYAKVIELVPNRWEDRLSMARIMLAGKQSWDFVYPYVAKAVEIGGDAARERIAKEDSKNLMASLFANRDPRLRELLGPDYFPSANPEQSSRENDGNSGSPN